MTLTAVSLFAGVGGFDLALERHGVEVVADVEIDKAARGVLERRFPNSKHFNDVTEVTGEQLRDAGFVPDRGILTGGFPCQDLSVAGGRAGLAGRRSGLYWEIVRLVDELSPKWIVLENVPGLLSSNDGRDFGAILGSLVERRYGVAYRILDAQHFGVPQRRRRVFIVGRLGDDGRAPSEVLALAQGVSGNLETGAQAGASVADDIGDGVGISRALNVKRRDDVNAETYLPVLIAMREDVHGSGDRGPLVSEDMSLTLATGNSQVLIQPYVKIVRSGARDENGELPAEVWAERDVAPTLNVMDNTGDSRATVLAGGQTAVRRLTPTECERLQGFPDGWTSGQNDGARYRQMGNAVAVPVVEWIIKRLVAVDE
jgi:DNA (cytosine-5)-methyltransferase 1